MTIKGIEGMSAGQIKAEIDRGGKFVLYQYCISVLIITFKRPTDIYFIRGDESAVKKGIEWSLLSLFFGWWGIPWGPIYTIGSLIINFRGGRNVTMEVIHNLALREPDIESPAVLPADAEKALQSPAQ